jgi:hypothetical protein
LLAGKSDVLVVSLINAEYDALTPVLDRWNLPIICESQAADIGQTCILIDDYGAGLTLGRWAAAYVGRRWNGRARVLDLTYHMVNTQARSRGFLDGLGELAPVEHVLSINAQSCYDTAYEMARDALAVDPGINIIFGINDFHALGAIDACKSLSVDPDSVMVVNCGLEGDTLKDILLTGGYAKAVLSMFPEIVGRVCVRAALAARDGRHLPSQLVTPCAVLTHEALPEFYERGLQGWRLRWGVARDRLPAPLAIYEPSSDPVRRLPCCIGLVARFVEHEWYRTLAATMRAYACLPAECRSRGCRRRTNTARRGGAALPGDRTLRRAGGQAG